MRVGQALRPSVCVRVCMCMKKACLRRNGEEEEAEKADRLHFKRGPSFWLGIR